MKTPEETRRELFEAWFESLNHRKPEIQYGMAGHYYLDHRTDAAWKGFNAAFDAVVIELPDKFTGIDEYDGRQTWDDCKAAIEASGLRVKS